MKIAKILAIEKPVLIWVGALFLFFLFLVPVINQSLYNQSIQVAESQALTVQTALESETQKIFDESSYISESRLLNNYIEQKNITNLITILTQEKNNKNLGDMLVTDDAGVVLTRTQPISRRGDNVFLTTDYGNRLSQDKNVKAVDAGVIYPLILLGGSPIHDNEKLIGSILVYRIINDNYVSQFTAKTLPSGSELAFYSNKVGLVGTSFQSTGAKSLISDYLNAGSQWPGQLEQNPVVKIDGHLYYLKNLVFPGIQKSPGGVVVFVPFNSFSTSLVFTAYVSIFFIILLLILGYFLIKKKKKHMTLLEHIIVISLLLLIIFPTIYFIKFSSVLHHVNTFVVPPFAIYNSTLQFNPEFGIYDKSYEQDIQIVVSPGGEAINAVQAVVKFDPALVKVNDILFTNSFCDPGMVLAREIDNLNGQVKIDCGLPNPGYSKSNGVIADLLVQPIKDGAFNLSFDPENSQVLANDGLGTNVLRMTTDGSYRVATSNAPVVIFSPTHPNSSRWYNQKDIEFNWQQHSGYQYSYYFGTAMPNQTQFTPIQTDQKTISVKDDGRYYFYLTGINGKTKVADVFPVQIDSTPPDPPTILASQTEVAEGGVVRFKFTSSDNLSGLQKNYYIKFDNNVFLPVMNELDVPFYGKGTHTVTVRAFDNANNYSDASLAITVK